MGSSKDEHPGVHARPHCQKVDEVETLYKKSNTQAGNLAGSLGSNQMVRKLRKRQVIDAIRQMENNPVLIPNFQGFSFQPFFVPASWPMNIVFLRKCWSQLLAQDTERPASMKDEDVVDVNIFARTMVRVCKVFNEQDRDASEFMKYDKDNKGFITWRSCCECWHENRIAVQLSMAERIYFTFDQAGSASSRLSSIVASFIMILIAISSLTFVLSSAPAFKATPEDCATCEPMPLPFFEVMEFIAGIAFSIEFFARFLTCAKVRFKYLDDTTLIFTLTSNLPIVYMTKTQRLCHFISSPSNVIDFLAIMPFYLEPVMPVNANLMVLRLVRLTRVFRVLKMGNLGAAREILVECITLSKPSLGMVLFIVAMQVLLSSCLVYYAEAGEWDAESQTYVRPCSPAGGDELCQSPFSSIPATFWWTFQTVTTVGYGDFSPTTGVGRVLGAITIIGGVIAFALPVGIIASNFDVAEAKFALRGSGIDEKQQADDEAVVGVLMDAFGVDGRAEIRFDMYDYDGDLDFPDFLGYSCLDVRSLGLDPNKADYVVFCLPLREDHLIAARKCEGSITVTMQWIPENYQGPNPRLRGLTQKKIGKSNVVIDSLAPVNVQRIPLLKGKLTVKIVNGRGLLNLDSRGQSDPFVVVTLYDQHTEPPNFVRWESRIVYDNCDPDFNQSTDFDLNWISSELKLQKPMSVAESYDRTPEDDRSKRLEKESIDAILNFPAQKIADLQDQLLPMMGKCSFNDEFNGVKY